MVDFLITRIMLALHVIVRTTLCLIAYINCTAVQLIGKGETLWERARLILVN